MLETYLFVAFDSNNLTEYKLIMTTVKYHSKYRFFISLLFRIVVFAGFLLVITPIIWGLFTETEFDNSLDKSHKNRYLSVSLAALSVGEIKKLKVAYLPVWIYKRRNSEVKQLSLLNALMMNPDLSKDLLSTQYFVFKPIESIRSCSIRYIADANSKIEELLAEQNLTWLGGFTESCFGSVYDLAGRRYRSTGKVQQKNLSVPHYSIKNTPEQGDVIQFDFKKMSLNE